MISKLGAPKLVAIKVTGVSVPMASDVLPDPDTPATATVRHSGT